MNNRLPVSPSVNNSQLHRRRLFWSWHRRLGLVAMVLVAILCVTGVLLNHTESLRLDEHPLRNRLLLALYGVERPKITSYALDNRWLSHLGGDSLYLDAESLGACQALTGLVEQDGMWVVGCGDELLLLTPDAELIERIGSLYQLPEPVNQLGLCGGKLCMDTGNGYFSLDLDQLQWQPLSTDLETSWSHPQALPDSLAQQLIERYQGAEISWERVILDLHSGRILGTAGVILMDGAALALLLLAFSGFWLWWSGPGRRR